MAGDACSYELSFLVGYLFASTGDLDGEQWIEDNLDGVIRDWSKIGYGMELAKNSFENFESFLARMPSNDARDNLVLYGVSTLTQMDRKKALRLYIMEYDNICTGATTCKDQAAYILLERFVQDESREDLVRWLQSDDSRLVTKGRENATALQISKSDPELALQWATEEKVDNETINNLLPRFLRQAAQGGDSETLARAVGYYLRKAS
jgi:hypothetical protein